MSPPQRPSSRGARQCGTPQGGLNETRAAAGTSSVFSSGRQQTSRLTGATSCGEPDEAVRRIPLAPRLVCCADDCYTRCDEAHARYHFLRHTRAGRRLRRRAVPDLRSGKIYFQLVARGRSRGSPNLFMNSAARTEASTASVKGSSSGTKRLSRGCTLTSRSSST